VVVAVVDDVVVFVVVAAGRVVDVDAVSMLVSPQAAAASMAATANRMLNRFNAPPKKMADGTLPASWKMADGTPPAPHPAPPVLPTSPPAHAHKAANEDLE
jgi:hypothetical protein